MCPEARLKDYTMHVVEGNIHKKPVDSIRPFVLDLEGSAFNLDSVPIGFRDSGFRRLSAYSGPESYRTDDMTSAGSQTSSPETFAPGCQLLALHLPYPKVQTAGARRACVSMRLMMFNAESLGLSSFYFVFSTFPRSTFEHFWLESDHTISIEITKLIPSTALGVCYFDWAGANLR